MNTKLKTVTSYSVLGQKLSRRGLGNKEGRKCSKITQHPIDSFLIPPFELTKKDHKYLKTPVKFNKKKKKRPQQSLMTY